MATVSAFFVPIYSFETGKYNHIADFGGGPFWLKDGRRLLFGGVLSGDSAIYLVNSQSRKIHEILSLHQTRSGRP